MPPKELVKLNPSTTLWRYMNFEKFVDLIAKSALFFPRANQFSDSSEGSFTMADIGPVEGTDLERVLKDLYHAPNGLRAHTLVSCWNIGETESELLWNRYTQGTGVAIQTTVQRLNSSLPDRSDMFSGPVVYDIRALRQPGQVDDLGTHIFFHKRPIYAGDREYRVTCHDGSIIRQPQRKGTHIPIDLNMLIEKIYILPEQDFQFDIATQWLQKFDLHMPVERSLLLTRAHF